MIVADALVYLELAGLVAKVGASVATAAVTALGKDTITLADVQALNASIKPPESYFASASVPGADTEG
jgi:hypothetical protein